jgi:EAL domain-containing protein (putative c-di-GMP-specific phosphodiesterase class I)
VQASLAAPIAIRGERFHVSASVGAVLGRRNTSASEMLRNADAAMYAAKAQGSGRIVVFDDEASRHARDRLDLSAELDHALERDQLSVVYQPIVELKTGKIRSFEALLRWTHPIRGPVPPDVFIAMAEESGAIVPIGAWVLERACALLIEWRHQFPEAGLTVGVNISAVQLEQSSRDLLDIIHGAGVAPRHVWLEVTERMDTSADIGDQVSRLRTAGVHFALDDFGMSYSSLTYLKRFPVEGIKIDRTFVAPMTEDETQRAIVQAILALGESLSIDVVAEGIETPEQLNALLDLGCRFGQGYLLTRPLTPDETFSALRAQASR